MWNPFKSRPIKLLEAALEEFEARHEFSGLALVKPIVLANIAKNPSGFAQAITEKGMTPQQVVATEVLNVAGDMLETGEHHVYRGVLSGSGEQLLCLFDETCDELIRLGAMTEDWKTTESAALRENIRGVG
jgi:hypothetical protein